MMKSAASRISAAMAALAPAASPDSIAASASAWRRSAEPWRTRSGCSRRSRFSTGPAFSQSRAMISCSGSSEAAR